MKLHAHGAGIGGATQLNHAKFIGGDGQRLFVFVTALGAK